MTLCTAQPKADALTVEVIPWEELFLLCDLCGIWKQNCKNWLLVLHGGSFDTSGFHLKTFSLFTSTLTSF